MQSLNRKIKRNIVAPVFNPLFQKFEFFRRTKNTGRFVRIPTPYGNTNNMGVGPGLSYNDTVRLQKKGKEALLSKPSLF